MMIKRILACFNKTFKENLRDWKVLLMTIVFAPFFVYLMYSYFNEAGATVYRVLVINQDEGGIYGQELIQEWQHIDTGDTKTKIQVSVVPNLEAAKKSVNNKDADLLMIIPAAYSASFNKFITAHQGTIEPLVSYGIQSEVKYIMTALFMDYTTMNYISQKTGIEVPFNVSFESANIGKNIRDFDLYVPALLVLSIIMMLFTAGASIVREIEKDTITRLMLSRLFSFEFMVAMSVNQVIIGFICIGLTFLAALSVGYTTTGSLFLLFLVGVLTCLGVIAISIITTCFIKNMFGLLTLGCFPFFILMFFSDCMMPLPKINLFRLAGNTIYLNDLLPTATATRAVNKILNFNATFTEVQFELLWILGISLVYFLIGIILFKKKYRY